MDAHAPLQSRGRRGGFTLVELVIAVSIYGFILAAGVAFVAKQNTMFVQGAERMTALQNLRYALSSMETDIPTVGTNVPTVQPHLIYADDNVVAFTGDYASNIANDIFAAYIDLGAPNGQVTVPSPSISIPNSSITWPDTLYLSSAGTRSPAELLMFWFALDTTTTRTDDYVLFRQVNDGSPEALARNILQSDSTPFFSYMRRVDFASAPSALVEVPDTALPIHHLSTFHRVPADTGQSALADSIRAVQVTMRSTNGLTGDRERIVAASRMISMPNAGFSLLQTCGDEPILGDTLGAALVDLSGSGDYASRLTWNAAVDETAGELDVARYVIYRQMAPISSDWGDPFLSIPAGLASYQYDDATVQSGQQYVYAIAAQDCTPMLSALEQSSFVIVP